MSGWAAVAQVAAEMTNSAMGHWFDRQLMSKQFEYQKEVLKNQNQWRVDDLRKAGLNPILAAGISSNAASGVTIPSGKQPKIDPISAMASAKHMKLTEQQTETEKNRTFTEEQNAKYVTAQTLKAEAEARLIGEQTVTAQLENQLRTIRLAPEKKQALLDEAKAMFDLEWDELWKIQKFANTAESVVDAVPFGKFARGAVDYLLGRTKVRPTLFTSKPGGKKKSSGFTRSEDY